MVFTKQMTLVDMLKHMKELCDLGMKNSEAFHLAIEEYTHSVIDGRSSAEINEAIEYLQKNDCCVGVLNTSNMIEQLERKMYT